MLFLLFALVAERVPAEPAAVLGLSLLRSVPQYARQEIAFRLLMKVENPYDADVIAVDGLVSAPSGREVRVPAFYYEQRDALSSSPGDGRGWRVRYTPTEPGTHLVRLVARLAKGQVRQLATTSFQCVPSRRSGFVSVKGRRFVLDNGDVFFPVGANRCWGDRRHPKRYLDDMERLASNGANCLRVWLAPWWLPLEVRPARFDQVSAALLDAIMAKAESLGLRVILCIEQHGNLQPKGAEIGRWLDHPYNAANGGPCRTRTEFFTHPEARRLFKNRLRYLVARWGYSTSLMAWELFNEVELVAFERYGFEGNELSVRTWHVEMADFLRRCDPAGHPVATSSDVRLQRMLLAEGAVAFLQVHIYKHQSLAARMREILSPLTRRVSAPTLVAEFGPIEGPGGDRRVTRGLFVAAVTGIGSGALPWLQDLDNPGACYRRLGAARRFFSWVRWADERLEPLGPDILVERRPVLGADLRRQSELAQPVKVVGLKGRDRMVLFLFAGTVAEKPTAQWVRIRIPGVQPGAYAMEVWNPGAGKPMYHQSLNADEDALLVELPECPAEVALKIERLEPARP